MIKENTFNREKSCNEEKKSLEQASCSIISTSSNFNPLSYTAENWWR